MLKALNQMWDDMKLRGINGQDIQQNTEAQKTFDAMHEFSLWTLQNVRSVLSTDGFEPYRHWAEYNIQPYLCVSYPPWRCMKQIYYIMPFVDYHFYIYSGDNIDVYLRSLVTELKELKNSSYIHSHCSTIFPIQIPNALEKT